MKAGTLLSCLLLYAWNLDVHLEIPTMYLVDICWAYEFS